MRFLDWLLGNSRIGSLKFLLLSGFFGLITLGLVSNYVYDSANNGRFLVTTTGVLPLLLIRWAYWSFRRKQLWRWVRAGDRKAIMPIFTLFQNRPSLVPEFNPILAIYKEHFGPKPQPTTEASQEASETPGA